jgi:hypothetical protein
MARSVPAQRIGLPSKRITTATTTAVKAGSGVIHRLVVETALAGIVTFNDNLGSKLILPAASLPVGVHELNMSFDGKIEVVTASIERIVVVYE